MTAKLPPMPAAEVPLIEQLRSVPENAVLRIGTPNALGCMDTRSIPVGVLCHRAAAQLQADRLAVWKAAIEAAAQQCEQVGPKDGPLKLVSDGFASAIRAMGDLKG